MLNLHASGGYPDEVASAQSLSFYVGNPPQLMQIFSGIAIPSTDSQGSLDYEDVLVHLNVPAPGEYPQDWDYTATVSLASVDSPGDATFTFATDECEVMSAAAVLGAGETDELVLHAKIAVRGSPAHVNRFSYHIEVLSKNPLQGAVLGTISWVDEYGEPSSAAFDDAQMFKVGTATHMIETSVAPQKVGRTWFVPYEIDGLPLDQPLDIVPSLLPGKLKRPDPDPFLPGEMFTPPFRLITLTTAVPSATNVDFVMTLPSVH